MFHVRTVQSSALVARGARVALAPLVALLLLTGCLSGPEAFIRHMDRHPEDQPPNWAEVKAMMARTAPAVGETAPDFTLATVDGSSRVTRSELQGDRPLVLIFGSYT